MNKAENAFSTNNGLILVLRIQSCIIGYNTQNGEQVLFKTVNDLRSLMIIDNYLHLEISNKNKIIRYLVDLTRNLNEIEWIKYDEKEVTLDIFIDKSLNANLKYIWITEKQVDLQMDHTKSHIILKSYDKNDPLNLISSIDIEYSLDETSFRVINNGKSVLIGKKNSIDFIIFNLQSIKNENKLEFLDFNLSNETKIDYSIKL